MFKFPKGFFRGRKAGKKAAVIVSACLALVLAAVLSGYLYLNGLLGKVRYSPGASAAASAAGEEKSSSSNSPQEQVDALEKQIEQNLSTNSTPLTYDQNVFNVLLIGTDNRADVEGSRSDSMILLSINKKTSKIVMTSLMRDIYLYIPGYGDSRLNTAYSYGGAKLLMQTVQQNFKIKVDRYVSVDFSSFIDIIDKLGGVRINVTGAELPILNEYVQEINQINGLSADNGLLKSTGSQLLTGKQALGYSRIRYVGDDYQRTERQRTVLTQVFAQLKNNSIVKQNEVLNELLPDVSTNLTKGELFSLLLSSPSYAGYQLEEDRIPVDGSQQNMVINQMDVLSIDFSKNISELQKEIYGAS